MKLTVIINHMLNIQHNLSVSPMSLCGHLLHTTAPRLEDPGWLGIQHKRYRQQPFDPFCSGQRESSTVTPHISSSIHDETFSIDGFN
jgi:hypothetical protein